MATKNVDGDIGEEVEYGARLDYIRIAVGAFTLAIGLILYSVIGC